jgi:uncharacterized membrane protein YgdD (TMEM256/DUF423 family)
MRIIKMAAGLAGASGVLLGAFGAHACKARLSAAGTTGVWDTAMLYHLIHAVALFSLAMLQTALSSHTSMPQLNRWSKRIGFCWSLGILLFSGSLYLLALGGPRWLGPITPLGGLAFIAGWACVLLSARHEKNSAPER